MNVSLPLPYSVAYQYKGRETYIYIFLLIFQHK